MQLCDQAGQIVTAHHLQGDDFDGAVVSGVATYAYRLKGRDVDRRFGQSGFPVVRLVESPMNLLDAALVVGRHVA
ncbi:Uncharacterised protein [Mycobacterium tuberculosis]|nr:Uncharacterised protein [Mycobacterium tuberculosis]